MTIRSWFMLIQVSTLKYRKVLRAASVLQKIYEQLRSELSDYLGGLRISAEDPISSAGTLSVN